MIKHSCLLSSLVLLTACTQAPAPTVDRSPTAQAERVAGPGEYQVKRGDTLFRIARENGTTHQALAALNQIDNPSALKEGQIIRLRPAEGAAPVAAAPMATPVAVGGGVEVRSLGESTVSTPVATTQGATKTQPRGGKEPYSDEAHARLNRLEAAAPVAAAAPAAAAPAAAPVEARQQPTPVAPENAAKPGTQSVDGIVWAWPTQAALKSGFSEAGNKGLDFAGKQGDPVLAAGDGKVLYVGEALAGLGKLVIVKHSANYLSVYAHNSRILVKEAQAVRRGEKIAEMGRTGTDSVKLHFEIRKQGKPVDPSPFLPPR